MRLRDKNPFFLILIAGMAALLAACSSPSADRETPMPSSVPSVIPSPAEAASSPTPFPTPIPTPEETDPPAWTGQAADFTGEWQRTNIFISFPATMEISNQTENGFDFSGWALWFSHGGEIEGTAYFTSENTAFWRYFDDWEPWTWTGTVTFTLLENGTLFLEQSGYLPFGTNAGVYGEYTLGEPEYITNGVLEALGPERIALLKEVVGDDYWDVGTPLEYGVFDLSDIHENGYSGLFLNGWFPTFGYDQRIYVGDDGAVWVNFADGRCYTNRPEEEMPGFLLYEEPKNS